MPTFNRGSTRERNKLSKDTKISGYVISLITLEGVHNYIKNAYNKAATPVTLPNIGQEKEEEEKEEEETYRRRRRRRRKRRTCP